MSVLVAGLVVSASAGAKVVAQGLTRAAILEASVNPSPGTEQCYEVYLASQGSSWGNVINPSSAEHDSACQQIQLGGYAFVHYAAGRWQVVTEGDEIGCPLPSRPHEPIIPSGVLKALTGVSCNQLPRVLNGYTTVAQYKPYLITTTGDGSGFYGGPTGDNVVPPSGRATDRLGRLKWTRYTSAEADATGVEWTKFGSGPTAEESYRIDATIRIHLNRPVDLEFSRMTVVCEFDRDSAIHGRRVYQFTNHDEEYWSETS